MLWLMTSITALRPAATAADRLAALRSALASQQLDGFIIPISDEHMSEYVGSYAQRLAWLTGFHGSAGSAVVLTDAGAGKGAAIATDGRYALQVRDQVDGALYDYVDVPAQSLGGWIAANASEGQRIGYDPWLHGENWVKAMQRLLEPKGVALEPASANPVDMVWGDRPAPSAAPVWLMDDTAAGQSAAEKLEGVALWLRTERADAVVITALDSIAWLLNIRGADVARTPVALSFAIVHADGRATWFIDPAKVDATVRQQLGDAVSIKDRAALEPALDAFSGKRVAVDPERTVIAIIDRLEAAGATVLRRRDPTILPKATKNAVELSGMRAAHVRDGAALSRFLRWVGPAAEQGAVDELAAAAELERIRREDNGLVDLSFDTIAGAGPNGALMHYRVSEETNRPLEPGSLFLVDSGGQYRDGTTDVTRTIAVGEPSAEMRRRFTQVLKGHIALATAVFPVGTRGSQLDLLARQFLWADGVDYAHGTGHGVGHFLSVHEGPQRIAKPAGGQAGTEEPLAAGMVLSNEPGYYKPGHFGIRIENLVIVEPRAIPGAEEEMLGFETITLAPIDRRLIDLDLLTGPEQRWIDAYHARVRKELTPLVDAETAQWLALACAPLGTA